MAARFLSGELGMIYVLLDEAEAGVRAVEKAGIRACGVSAVVGWAWPAPPKMEGPATGAVGVPGCCCCCCCAMAACSVWWDGDGDGDGDEDAGWVLARLSARAGLGRWASWLRRYSVRLTTREMQDRCGRRDRRRVGGACGREVERKARTGTRRPGCGDRWRRGLGLGSCSGLWCGSVVRYGVCSWWVGVAVSLCRCVAMWRCGGAVKKMR